MKEKETKFFTKFDKPVRYIRNLSREDNVDRMSYVDNTLLVQKFLAEGKNLAFNRSHALYHSFEDIENETMPAPPVFPVDPAIAREYEDIYKSGLSSGEAVSGSGEKPDLTEPVSGFSGSASASGSVMAPSEGA